MQYQSSQTIEFDDWTLTVIADTSLITFGLMDGHFVLILSTEGNA